MCYWLFIYFIYLIIYLKLFQDDTIEVPAVDGGWSEWEPWSECSARCGLGTKATKRTCIAFEPDASGADCEGEDSKTEACEGKECPGKQN